MAFILSPLPRILDFREKDVEDILVIVHHSHYLENRCLNSISNPFNGTYKGTIRGPLCCHATLPCAETRDFGDFPYKMGIFK